MHRTNAQKLIELFKIDPTVFETVPAVSRSSDFQLPIDVFLADSKEAIEQESKDNANMKIYMDGSNQNGLVGASAVLYYTQNGAIRDPSMIRRCQLGPDTKHSVREAEAAGVLMALWMIGALIG